MDKKIIIGIILVSILVFIVSLLVPLPIGESDRSESERPTNQELAEKGQFLPWHIDITPEGDTRVFGLTLGETTLGEANDLFHGGAEVSLFLTQRGRYRVEAFFDKVVLGGFSSQMILVVSLSQEQQVAMYKRGTRVSSLGGGRKKVTLSTEDIQLAYASPIGSLTYLTRARLDHELLHKRFGEPAEIIKEHETNTEHWLYPELGLDIAISTKGQAVLQYVPPGQFSELKAPLLIKQTGK